MNTENLATISREIIEVQLQISKNVEKMKEFWDKPGDPKDAYLILSEGSLLGQRLMFLQDKEKQLVAQ